MKSKYITPVAVALLIAGCLFMGCSKEITKYKDLLDNREIIYPGPVSNFSVFQGNLRIKLQWNPSPDPSITKYMIYWNNNRDSLTLNAAHNNTLDSVSTVIESLDEYVQNFVLYTLDDKGNRSVGQSLSGVRIFGPLYISSLVNRALDAAKPPEVEDTDTYKLYFAAADTILNAGTQLTYTGTDNLERTVNLAAKYDTAMLDMAAAGTKVAIRTSYLPVHRAIDTFRVAYSDTLVLQ
ncbi:DUF4998 domain-containing protein [Chitinophaga alhagiae]|uniref:DUF4998 domain-containing protein n=1 Tax=Chitinophaga alhagiae TaxID=2203219 RepID=UPI0013004DA7|nr:DUF4998 domain-containing protein [Chitinophaga alhagiae]